MEVAYSEVKVRTLGVRIPQDTDRLKKVAKAISAGISRNEHVQTVKSPENFPLQSSNVKHKNIPVKQRRGSWGELLSL